ncbi:MAG TPA: ATP-binding protein [Vicinamibacterales bacterium]|nr:ATP-binding protein [Vicinamibacterales bacterium]
MNGATVSETARAEQASAPERATAASPASRRASIGSGWSRLSIATKLPLILAILLSVVFGGMTAAVYQQVKASVLAVASERLARAGQQMADLLATSMRQRTTLVNGLIERSNAAAYLQTPSPELQDQVVRALARQVGAASQSAAVELWTADRRVLHASGFQFPPMAENHSLAIAVAASQSKTAVVLPYRRVANDLMYSVATAVRRDERVIGYLVERRKLTSAAPTVALLTGLIGSDAKLLLGNAAGDVWTDLSVSVPAPPLSALATTGLAQYRRGDGPAVLARFVPVADTPWLVAVEFPRDTVMGPAQRFLIVALGLSALLTAGGVLTGWRLSRRITIPLRQVTEAAEAIAADRSAARIEVRRADEVGRLAQSFNSMAAQVEDSRRRLEGLVEELEGRVTHRTAALEAANRELEAFSYSVSHDLRAPLRAVDGFARILVEDHGRELTPEARKCLDVITDRTRHMGNLIDDLLRFSRLGRQPLTRGSIDMTALATTVAEDLRRADPERAVDITVDPLPPAQGERSLIKQVLVNLMQNALKFTRSRPQAHIVVGCRHDAGDPVYFVRDNGVGFDMTYADKLFGVFQRLHRAEDFEGTGVGLAIVQRIINRHGGRVWAEAAIDQGATFFFTLPEKAEQS